MIKALLQEMSGGWTTVDEENTSKRWGSQGRSIVFFIKGMRARERDCLKEKPCQGNDFFFKILEHSSCFVGRGEVTWRNENMDK